MGKVFQGNSGKEYIIEDNKIAGGGEGGIYLIEDNENQVAKIFKPEKRTTQREEKIRLMVKEELNFEQLKQITWPQDVIYNQDGFVGYVMPKLQNTASLTEIYNTEKYDLRYRLMAAVNLCAAIDTVHEMGQVCGDLNPQNICINLDLDDRENAFYVTLVDTDSYHYTANNKTYRCEVGLGDYIAPELQKKMANGMDLKTVQLPSYTRETDLFALAVHIFCLLMNGCHPFACAKDASPRESNINQMAVGTKEESIVAPQPIENIINGFFPFADEKEGITIPVYAPEFKTLPLHIQELFIKTFKEGFNDPSKRVSASEWNEALLSVLGNIIKCSENERHFYFSHVDKCPLCEIDEKINDVLRVDSYSDASLIDVKEDTIIQSKENRWKNRIGLGLIAAIYIAVIIVIGAYNYDNRNDEDDYYLTEEATESVEDLYKEMIEVADNYLSSNQLDEAISKCDEAIEFSPGYCDAYYIKAKALYEKKDLKQASIVLSDEEANGEGRGFKYVNGEAEKLREDISEANKNVKRLKKLNKIIAKIRGKKYKKAGKLIDDFCGDNQFGKIYIKDGGIVDSIKKGKGFMIDKNGYYAYYGNFKKGKMSGKGIQVGYDYRISGYYKNDKLNGRAEVYCWEDYLNTKVCKSKKTGTYKNDKENGSMRITYYDGENGTYYYEAHNGKVNYFAYEDGLYCYAKTADGKWLGYENKSVLNDFVSPAVE